MKYKEKGYNRLLVAEQYGWSEFEYPLIEEDSQNHKIAKI
jgi:hypothetical protein